MDQIPNWMLRAIRVVVAAAWAGLVIGVLESVINRSEPMGSVVTAAILSGVFVVTLTGLPRGGILRNELYFEILVITGALLTVASATLTGRTSSPYMLLALVPTLLAAITSGLRMGVTTALLSGGLLASVVVTAEDTAGFVSSVGTIALFPLIGLIVAQIRSLLVEVSQQASTLEEASVHTEAELARLGQANELLRRLTDVYGDGRASPVDLGRSALEAIVDANPGSFATAAMFDATGPVLVARVGTDAPDLVRTQIPLGEGETTSGVVSLATPHPLTSVELHDINTLLRPVAVSFTNTVLLQDIASTAVREERLRLARELHDEVGPALAALGLSLDATQMHSTDPGLKASISYVREGLGSVIDDLRGIIADLRSETSGSLVSSLTAAISDLAPPPSIEIDVHERRPPRAIAMRQILAIMTESVRNAYRHADAQAVKVTGIVDRDRVDIEVRDDGKGFDPFNLPEGHYGILGMRERADRIGARIEVASAPDGTTVRLSWKEKK